MTEIDLAPAGNVIGIQDPAGLGMHGAGHADGDAAKAGARPGFGKQTRDAVADLVEDALRAGFGQHPVADFLQDLGLAVGEDEAEVGRAHVDGDAIPGGISKTVH